MDLKRKEEKGECHECDDECGNIFLIKEAILDYQLQL